MISKAPARAVISFILGPSVVLAAWIGWVAASENLADATDSEGLAYLLVFTGFALPGVVAALLMTWFLGTRNSESNVVVQLAFASLVGLVVTCSTFSLVLALVGGWSMLSNPVVLVLPALIGILSCVMFVGLGAGKRQFAA